MGSLLNMSQDQLYEDAAAEFGAALERLARSYEADGDKRRDLLQEIHLALWRSFERFAGNCSMRTWIYRVAHNVAASHVIRARRANGQPLVALEAIESLADPADAEAALDRQKTLERVHALIRQLTPLDRQLIVLYLEGLDAATIGDITGLSAGNTATKIHRIKKVLARRFQTERSAR